MKAKELMLGDWIVVHDHGWNSDGTEWNADVSAKITDIGDGGICAENGGDEWLNMEYGRIDPVPLTREILEKNGFYYCKRTGGCYLYTTISYGNWDAEVVLFDVNSEYRNNQLHIGSPDDSDTFLHLMECNYVHELQHALRLCGIEKEIEL